MVYPIKSCLVFVLWMAGALAHPDIFVGQAHCSTVLAVGSYIMSKPVVSGNTRQIVVKRNDMTLVSGDLYVANEILSVTLDDESGIEYALQVTEGAAIFPGGGCDNTRRASGGNLEMPSTGSVTINGGSASSESTVTMFDDFVLNCCNTTASAGTASPTKQDTAKPAAVATGVGIALPCFLIVLAAAFLFYFAGHSESVLAKGASLVKIPSYIAVAAGISAVVLVIFWAQTQNGDSTDYQYIGTPNWKTNTFAWHPVLMVGGLFFGQVVAINDWNLLPSSHAGAKGLHVFFQTGAVVCMAVGLTAVMKQYVENKNPLFTTMHSWMGLGAIFFLVLNYSLGFFMACLTAVYPDSHIRKVINWVGIHRVSGLCSLGMTCQAIVSGIMDQLPEGACAFPIGDPEYGAIYKSCQIAYSIGVMAVVSGIFTVLAVSLRHDRVKVTPVVLRKNAARTHDEVATGDDDKDGPAHHVEMVELSP